MRREQPELLVPHKDDAWWGRWQLHCVAVCFSCVCVNSKITSFFTQLAVCETVNSLKLQSRGGWRQAGPSKI